MEEAGSNSVPIIPKVESFVELFHWLRHRKFLIVNSAPDHRELFATLDRLGMKDAERLFIVKFRFDDATVDSVPTSATWGGCFDCSEEADDLAVLHAKSECEEELRRSEFPRTWVVDHSHEWPQKPIRSPQDLETHLRDEAITLGGFESGSPVWKERAVRLLENAENAALGWRLVGLPDASTSDTLSGYIYRIQRLADWLGRIASPKPEPATLPADLRAHDESNREFAVEQDGPFGDHKLRLGGKVHELNKNAERSWRLLNSFWSLRLEELVHVDRLTGPGQPWDSMPDDSNITSSLNRFKNEMPMELNWQLSKSKWEIKKVSKSR